MPAEKIEVETYSEAPVINKEAETVTWRGREFPFITFCMIHMAIRELLEFREIYSKREGGENKPHIFQFLITKSLELTRHLSGISVDAWSEAFYASLALQKYLWDEDEASGLEAKERLLRVRRHLLLDQIFRNNKFSSGI